ncbi:hypothetical protein JZ751_028205 [Albula glossodonta]|uniref:Uncharacterized protein n=1 Tax=Albula glossodonta TaxID=121402 RepID=A0A8T2PL32_9TELE|nr:hypothetical protein JZ751_028205 [Albula glossodonta]
MPTEAPNGIGHEALLETCAQEAVAVPEGRQPFSVARQSRERNASPTPSSITKIPTSKARVAALMPPRPNSACSLPKTSPLAELYGPRPSSAGPHETPTQQRPIDKHSVLRADRSADPDEPPVYQVVRVSPIDPRLLSPAGGASTESARSRSARSGTSTPHTPSSAPITPGTPPSYSCRTPGTPGTPSYPRTPGTPKSLSLLSQERKVVAIIRTPPKSPATTPKQLRVLNQPLPDLKNVKSKIGSTDNIKYQPKGGQSNDKCDSKEQLIGRHELIFISI